MKVQLFSFYKENFFVSPIVDRMPGQQDAMNWDFAFVEGEDGGQTVFYAGADYIWNAIPEGVCAVAFEFIDAGPFGKSIKYKEAPEYAGFRQLSGES